MKARPAVVVACVALALPGCGRDRKGGGQVARAPATSTSASTTAAPPVGGSSAPPSTTGGEATDQAGRYVGQRYTASAVTGPAGARVLAEATIVEPYGVSHVRDRSGQKLLFVQTLGQSGTTQDRIVLDAVSLPERPGHELAWGGSCSVHGRPDPAVVALVRFSGDRQHVVGVAAAWRFDIPRRKIEPLPTAGLDCTAEDAGV